MKTLLPHFLFILIGLSFGIYLSELDKVRSVSDDLEIQLAVSKLRVTDPEFFFFIGAYRRVQGMLAEGKTVGATRYKGLFEKSKWPDDLKEKFVNQYFGSLTDLMFISSFQSSFRWSNPWLLTVHSLDSDETCTVMQHVQKKSEEKMQLLLGDHYNEYRQYGRTSWTRHLVNDWLRIARLEMSTSTRNRLIDIIIEENIAAGLMSASDPDDKILRAIKDGLIPIESLSIRDDNVLLRVQSLLTDRQIRVLSSYLATKRREAEQRARSPMSTQSQGY